MATGDAAPRWFQAVVWMCLIWNGLLAVDDVLIHLHVGWRLAPMSIAMVALLPFWVRVAWALGVWGAVVGAALMMARVRHAAVAYALAFAGAVASLTWQYAHGANVVETGFLPAALVLTGAIMAQMWLSRVLFWRGVLR